MLTLLIMVEISATVRSPEISEADALSVKEYLVNMFATTQKGEDRTAPKFITRFKWMKFLNAAYAKFFNPVFPNHSGSIIFINFISLQIC